MLVRLLLAGIIIAVTLFSPVLSQNATSDTTDRGDASSAANPPQHQQYSSLYIVQITLGVDKTTSLDRAEMSKRLSGVVSDALERRAITHLQQDIPVFSSEQSTNSHDISVQITHEDRRPRETTVYFVVFAKRNIVPAEVIINDLVLLPFTHISARLRYPVTSMQALKTTEDRAQSRWWLIALIMGSGALILLCGWILLVIYFNTCAPTPSYRAKSPLPGPVRSESEDKIASHQAPSRLEISAAEVDEPSSKPSAVVVQQYAPTKPKKLPEIEQKHSCNGLKIEHIVEDETKIGESEDGDIDNDSVIRQIRIVDEDVFMDESPREKEESIADSPAYEQHLSAKRLLRPKSAGPRRPLRTAEGEIIQPIHPNAREWSPYYAGDQVAQIFYIGATLHGHPTPAPPSDEGVLVMRNVQEGQTSKGSEPFDIL